jgi:hypothetical protein
VHLFGRHVLWQPIGDLGSLWGSDHPVGAVVELVHMEAAVAHIRDPLPGAVNARINGRLRCMQPAGLPVGRGQPESAPEREDDLRGGSVGRVRDDAASPLPHPLSSCALRFGDLVFVLQARRVDEKAFVRPVDCPKAGGALQR